MQPEQQHGRPGKRPSSEEKVLREIKAVLIDIRDSLARIGGRQEASMATIQDVKDAVAANKTVADSVVELVKGLAQKLSDALAAGADPVALQEIVDELNANTQNFADAVEANTPNQINPL